MTELWELSVYMDTDDDCEITFRGKTYCYHGDYLRITERGPDHAAALAVVREIQVTPGQKVSDLITEFIQEFITLVGANPYERFYEKTMSGNQKLCFLLYPMPAPKPKYTIEPCIDGCPDDPYLGGSEVYRDGREIARFIHKEDARAYVAAMELS